MNEEEKEKAKDLLQKWLKEASKIKDIEKSTRIIPTRIETKRKKNRKKIK